MNTVSTTTTVPLQVWLAPDAHRALKAIAQREHRSMSGQVRKWIEDAQEPEREAA